VPGPAETVVSPIVDTQSDPNRRWHPAGITRGAGHKIDYDSGQVSGVRFFVNQRLTRELSMQKVMQIACTRLCKRPDPIWIPSHDDDAAQAAPAWQGEGHQSSRMHTSAADANRANTAGNNYCIAASQAFIDQNGPNRVRSDPPGILTIRACGDASPSQRRPSQRSTTRRSRALAQPPPHQRRRCPAEKRFRCRRLKTKSAR